MKLTKAKLQRIIKEELAEITEPSYKFAPKADPDFGRRPDDLEKELGDTQSGRESDQGLIDDVFREIEEIAQKHGGEVELDLMDIIQRDR